MAEETATIPTVDIDVLTSQRDGPHLEAMVFADYAARTTDGKATVAGIFDRVFIDPDKRASGRFFVYMRTVETLDAPVEMKVVDPKGRVVAQGSTSIIDTATFAEAPFPKSVSSSFPLNLQLGPEGVDGPYWFEILYKGRSLGGAVLRVEFRRQEDSL